MIGIDKHGTESITAVANFIKLIHTDLWDAFLFLTFKLKYQSRLEVTDSGKHSSFLMALKVL